MRKVTPAGMAGVICQKWQSAEEAMALFGSRKEDIHARD